VPRPHDPRERLAARVFLGAARVFLLLFLRHFVVLFKKLLVFPVKSCSGENASGLRTQLSCVGVVEGQLVVAGGVGCSAVCFWVRVWVGLALSCAHHSSSSHASSSDSISSSGSSWLPWLLMPQVTRYNTAVRVIVKEGVAKGGWVLQFAALPND
jgi:hypothetical protein